MQKNWRTNNFKAFTLIELSIVLVIIGLIVGGVLVGRDLIKAAAIRQQIKQLEEYQLAVNTFYGKYGCLPGDCNNITNFLPATDSFGVAVTNGNGNGQIDTLSGLCYDDASGCGSDFWSTSTELWGAFQQLSLANMINFVPVNHSSTTVGKAVPAVALSPAAGFFIAASYNFGSYSTGRNPYLLPYQTGNNLLWLVDCSPAGLMGQWDNGCALFYATDVQSIDTKIDDGKPLSGKFIGFGGSTSSNDCLAGNGLSSTYKTSNTTKECQAAFVIN